jgi:hypothetical protein
VRRTRLLVPIVAMSMLLGGCGDAEERQNVRPPQPGTPSGPEDVQGIYRSIRHGLLQLRGNGEFVLIVSESPGASSGTYTLEDGRLTVRTNVCGEAVGTYDLQVGGQPVAGEATLAFTTVSDDCDFRRRWLTVDPWVYADS